MRLSAIAPLRRAGSRWDLARAPRLALFGALLGFVSVSVGCADGDETSADAANEASLSCEERLPSDDVRAAALMDRMENHPVLSDVYDEVSLEERAPVRCIAPDEFGTAMSTCMNDEGFEAGLTPDGEGVSWEKIPPDQLHAAQRASDACELRFPVDPIYTAPLDEDQLTALYEHLLDATIPCLRAEGHQIAEPPSFAVFAERWDTPQAYSPFSELNEAGIDLASLLEACPERPPTDEVWPG